MAITAGSIRTSKDIGSGLEALWGWCSCLLLPLHLSSLPRCLCFDSAGTRWLYTTRGTTSKGKWNKDWLFYFLFIFCCFLTCFESSCNFRKRLRRAEKPKKTDTCSPLVSLNSIFLVFYAKLVDCDCTYPQ